MQPLVSRAETWLADGGLLAVIVGLILRVVVLYFMTHTLSLTDRHIVGAALLVALLNLAGLLLPRTLSAVPVLLGAASWLYAFSLAQKYSAIWRTGELPDWQVYAAVGLALASFVARLILRQRWGAQIYGKGWAWIDNWAQAKSLRARVLARRALVTLGYRRARDTAAE